MAVDGAMNLQPAWMLVYGSIWVFMLLPFLVVREDDLIIRMLASYITVVVIAYAAFLVYPTVGPRPAQVLQEGFFAWTLRRNYAFDPRIP
jgi:hypothetical protein